MNLNRCATWGSGKSIIAGASFAHCTSTPAGTLDMVGRVPTEFLIRARDYDLAATLMSGQAFRWEQTGDCWEGVIGEHWVELRTSPEGISARTATPPKDWRWLTDYLQTE